jgi:hypothetical protein
MTMVAQYEKACTQLPFVRMKVLADFSALAL